MVSSPLPPNTTSSPASPLILSLPLLIVVLGLVVVEFGNPFARQAGTAALVGLSALKLIESERRRDGLLIMTVSLFLVSVQFLFNQSIGITLYMVIPTLLVFLALNEIAANLTYITDDITGKKGNYEGPVDASDRAELAKMIGEIRTVLSGVSHAERAKVLSQLDIIGNAYK